MDRSAKKIQTAWRSARITRIDQVKYCEAKNKDGTCCVCRKMWLRYCKRHYLEKFPSWTRTEHSQLYGNSVTGNGHYGWVKCLTALPGNLFASGSEDKTIKLWADDSCIDTLLGCTSQVLCMKLMKDGTHLAAGSLDAGVRIWDTRTGQLTQEFRRDPYNPEIPGHSSRVDCLATLGSDIKLASGSHDKTIMVWNTENGLRLHTLTGHQSSITSLVTLGDGIRLGSASQDRDLRLWDTNSGECLNVLIGHNWSVTCLKVLGDGETLASGSLDTTIKIWNTKIGKCVRTLGKMSPRLLSEIQSGKIRALARFTGDDPEAFGLKIEDMELAASRQSILDLEVLGDGETLVFLEDSRMLHLCNSKTGKYIGVLEGHTGMVNEVHVFKDGRTLATGARYPDTTIRIWDTLTGRCKQKLRGHTDSIYCLTTLEDGSLVSGSYDETVRMWKLEKLPFATLLLCFAKMIGRGSSYFIYSSPLILRMIKSNFGFIAAKYKPSPRRLAGSLR